jgi:predicted permease
MRLLWHDLRQAFRTLRRNKGFASIALVTLALVIGVNTAIFSLLDSIVLRGLPVRNPSRLVAIYRLDPNGEQDGILLPILWEIEHQQRVFSGIFGYNGGALVTTDRNGTPSPVDLDAVTGHYYSVLGVKPLLGRLISPADVGTSAATSAQVAVIGYDFWQRKYGANPDVIGKALQIDKVPLTIIGVTPKSFFGLWVGFSADVTVPITSIRRIFGDAGDNTPLYLEYAIGRLRPEVSIRQARAQLELLWPRILRITVPPRLPPQAKHDFLTARLRVQPAGMGFYFQLKQFIRPLYLLLAIASFVLLVGCANLASLMLARAEARRHELAIRAALGASPARLARQFLTENVLIAAIGALAGLLLAYLAARMLANFVLSQTSLLPGQVRVTPDWRILGFTAGAALLTILLFGLAPALYAARREPRAALQEKSDAVTWRGRTLIKKWLIVGQVGLSFVLLIGAGLFVRSFESECAVDPGFQSRGLVDARLAAIPGGYRNFNANSYYPALVKRLSEVPGVTSVSLSHLMVGHDGEWRMRVSQAAAGSKAGLEAGFAIVSPGFFRTLRLPLLRGRSFTWQDNDHSPRVAILSEGLARKLFPKGGAVGQHIDVTGDLNQSDIEVVGIVSEASLWNVIRPHSFAMYVPWLQEPGYDQSPDVELRVHTGQHALINKIRRVVPSLGREYVMTSATVSDRIEASLLPSRLMAWLAGLFGALALVLTLVGIYGVISYSVRRRTHELGIRIALGAQKKDVLGLVIGQGMILALIGIGIGIVVALALGHLVANLLYDVKPMDPQTFILASVILAGAAFLASYIPARRAIKVDPMVAVRHE